MPVVFDLMPFAKQLEVKYVQGKPHFFDKTRRVHLKVTPEEIVRQSLIIKLHADFGIPWVRMRTEYGIKHNSLQKRIDLLIYDKKGKPWMIIETKAPTVPLSQLVIDQVAFYNNVIFAPWLMVANGNEAMFASVDFQSKATAEVFKFPLNQWL
ncbi:MAG: type I restriction enzyme HsdR N-terminal domain-containing protein [Saprospiraceae bacterium]|nr:type I restriction enzyme HsdR N-terminal domain-containing protein [Saprospiraceae bacterium]WKZ63380.1 MAG: type I restriction enzyme HsdR N-terminal domain-containing protein [Saprospiraceae bacterium]